jgi:PAS domain S-box-containing protein
MLSGLIYLGTSIRSLPKPGAVTWVSLGVMLFFWWAANQWASEHLVSEAKSEASVAVSLRANTISAGLNRQLALLDGLYAYVITEPSERDLQDKYIVFAEALSAHATGVRNIVTAPGGVMQFVYPVEGNLNVIGYNPLDDARQNIREDVNWAIENKHIVISGPAELVQGGIGIIARMPVFKNDEFWGLVNIVLDLDPILESAQFDLQTGSMSYAIREENGHVFFGQAALFDNDPVISRIDLPEGYWELAAVPPSGWIAFIQRELRVFQSAGMAFIGLLTGLIYLSNFRQSELEGAVKERTIEISKINQQMELELVERRAVEAGLRERESQYRSIYESVSDGLFINSLEGKLVDFNQAAAKMHGYSVDEFKSLQPADFIHPDSLKKFSDYIDLAKQGVEFRVQAIDIKKDGAQFPVEVYGMPFIYGGELHSLAILRDITEQVEAYQRLEKRVEERTHELASLLNASQTLTSTLDLEALLGLILDQLKTIVDYEGASIFGFDEEGLKMKVYIGPIVPVDQERLPHLIQTTCSNTAFSKREPLVYDDIHQVKEIQTEVNVNQSEVQDCGFSQITSLMCIPLMVKDKLTGVLALHHNQAGYFQLSQGALAVAFANQAAIAIENANLYQQAQSLAALEERQKLARELHDSVSQALYGIALGARTVRTILDRRSTDDKELIRPADYILSLAEAGLAEMRALIFELRPESLEMEGLVAALEKQAASITARHQIQVLTSFASEPSLSIEVKEALYRISQEALQNVIKHAKADSVHIQLQHRSGIVVLEIQDNGIGFDSNRSFPGHLGLLSMKERVKKAGGELVISSSPGRGTVVTASIKVEEPVSLIP